MANENLRVGGVHGAAEEPCWRQCSLCTPSNPAILPNILAYDPQKDLLLIATQTCSLVGKGAEPAFEVVAVSLVENFNSSDPEAKGKITRFLQLPLEADETGRGIRVDVSRRALLPSDLLHQMQPAQVQVSESALKAFQGWIARYYGRIALPDELDRRLRKRQFHKKVEKAFGQTLLDGTVAYKVHTDIDRIYIDWQPDVELPSNKNYMVAVLIVCRRHVTQKHLLETLSGLASGVKKAPLVNGLVMDDPDVKLAKEVTVEHMSKMKRFTAFDEFSSLAEVAKAMGDE